MPRPEIPKFGPWRATPWTTITNKVIGYQCSRLSQNGVLQVATTYMATRGRHTLEDCRVWAQTDADEHNGVFQ